MRDDVEDLLERAGHVRTPPVDPEEIWVVGRRRQRRRRAVQAATATLVAVALAVPVGVAAYRDLATPGVDVADNPPTGGPAPLTTETAECPTPGAGPSVDRARGTTAVAAAIDAAGVALPSDPPDRFEDDDGATAEAAIDQLAALGVLEGTRRSSQEFAPEAPLTRGQLASLLVRSYETVTGDRLEAMEGSFVDDGSSPHAADAAKAAAAGLLGPAGATTFALDDHVDAGQLDAAAERLAARLAGRQLPACLIPDGQK